jgi:aquaporin Z
VTFGFALRGVFPWPRAAAYVVAQFVGAFAAAGLAFALYGGLLGLGASHPGPGFSSGVAVACECVLTAMTMFVILATAREEAVVGKDAALAIGFTIAACGFCAGAISGASMNPARTIAPQLLAEEAKESFRSDRGLGRRDRLLFDQGWRPGQTMHVNGGTVVNG